ncbi:uncharacterized protein STEHIDRAFT_154665 [Stereum hirsutum FP-91666 SS1]|uniref:uncharacterized protein n=1 Tax=Stereum hirsutum (strain FP-91666) TaxID=721885 RepID=UPI000440F94E|nr:uncharacterized protein STEHIDRAFT_154665 [Stereum hirsutum FP-91666 SS1]EIM88959.1 hypothetical protein STEHIDRAFT_154665 [Stereum hirsutum FP-91666 SS1]
MLNSLALAALSNVAALYGTNAQSLNKCYEAWTKTAGTLLFGSFSEPMAGTAILTTGALLGGTFDRRKQCPDYFTALQFSPMSPSLQHPTSLVETVFDEARVCEKIRICGPHGNICEYRPVLMADVFCFPLGERIVGQGGTFGWTDGAVMAEEESDWYDSNKIGQRLSEAERRNKIAKPERKEKRLNARLLPKPSNQSTMVFDKIHVSSEEIFARELWMIGNYALVTATTLWLVDFVATLPAEVSVVWSHKPNFCSIVFLLNRYMFLMYLSLWCIATLPGDSSDHT